MAIDRNVSHRTAPRLTVRIAVAGLIGVIGMGLAWSHATAERDHQGIPPEALVSQNASDEAYTTGFDRYRQCLLDTGHDVTDLIRSADGLLYEWKVPGAAVESGRDESCYVKHLYARDVARQMIVSTLRGDAEALETAAISCAARFGLTADPQDFDSVARELAAQGSSITECVGATVQTSSGNELVGVLPSPGGVSSGR